LRVFSFLLLALLAAGCARMGPPDGGERDTTPPRIIYSLPEVEAVSVDPGAPIVLKFSKYMDRASVSQAAFFSPPLSGEVIWRWRGRTVRITHTEPFAAQRTTVMTLGAGMTDYSGNEMREPFALAFSTSELLERGVLRAGITGLPPRETAELWLVDSIQAGMQPLHVLPVKADGRAYDFLYLPEGRRQLVAVQDIDHDRSWHPFSERIGFPRQPVTVPDTTNLHLFHLDYAYPDTVILNAARPLHSRLLRLSGFFPDSLRGSGCQLCNWPGTELYTAPVLFADRFQALLAIPAAITADSARLSLTGRYPSIQLRFATSAFSDTFKTAITGIDPRGADVLPGNRITVTAGEPLLLADPARITVLLNSVDTVAVERVLPLPEGGVIEIAPGWNWSDTCEVRLEAGCLSDVAGNTVPDSTLTRRFAALERESLGGLDGLVTGVGADADIWVQLRTWLGDQVAVCPAGPDFSFTDIPAGEYAIRLWCDLDGDGAFSGGSADPFIYAEPYVVLRDTFQVAPRWQVGGLLLDGKELLDE